MTKSIPYRLPRTKLKTKSLRKAYNRVRRASPIVYLETPSDEMYSVNGHLIMHPEMLAKISKKLSDHFEEEYFGTIGQIKVECEPKACCTMDGVTIDGIKSAMGTFKREYEPDPILDQYAFPAQVDIPLSDFRWSKWDGGFVSQQYPVITNFTA